MIYDTIASLSQPFVDNIMSVSAVLPALLVLADGTTYSGQSFGAMGTTIGEVVFNTGMTGYQEVLTDPSYSGQIVVFTYPELGNTGVNPDDEESQFPQIKGAIARNICYRPSNWRSTASLPKYLEHHNVPGIYGIDTRALTRKLRSSGAMNGAISTEILDPAELLNLVRSAPDMAGLNLVDNVTTPETYEWSEPSEAMWEFKPESNASIYRRGARFWSQAQYPSAIGELWLSRHRRPCGHLSRRHPQPQSRRDLPLQWPWRPRDCD
jgi:carbamoyl-phosphate synthase small subunit